MNDRSRQFVFVVYLNSHLPQFALLLKHIQEHHLGQSTLVLANPQEVYSPVWLIRMSANCQRIICADGTPYTQSKNSGSSTAQQSPRSPSRSGVGNTLRRVPVLLGFIDRLKEALTIWPLWRRLRREQRQAAHLLTDLRADVIILPEENIIYFTTIYSHTAERLGLEVIIFPYTVANQSEFYEPFFDFPGLRKNFCNRIVSWLFPHWVFIAHGQWMVLQPWSTIIFLELLKLVPPNPWMINSSRSGRVVAESDHMFEYYQRHGLPEQSLVKVGSLSDDILADSLRHRTERRNALYAQYGLNPNKPLLLAGAFPERARTEKWDFANYHEMIDFWLRMVTEAEGWNIIINLHPRIDSETVEYIRSLSLTIVDQPVVELIPLCDLYVANISATIRWAIACGVPVLNCDLYKLRFHDYDSAPGVITVESPDDIRREFKRLTKDSVYLAQQRRQQQTCQQSWGMLDGKSGNRITRLLSKALN